MQRILRAKLISPAQWRQYNYLILAHRNPDGRSILEESRTDAQNRSIGREAGSPRSLGFSYAWLRFIPQNLPQSRFRYLGQQKIDRHQTFVVAFAEDPKKVKVPGAIVFEEKLYPLLTQGVAWIDQATYRIVRLQTDLLAPLPSISLLRLSSDLRFSEVRIPEVAEPLWLPKQVEIQWEQENQISAELHQYSGYRLFHATFRMVPAP